MSIEEKANMNYSLCNVQERHCLELLESMRVHSLYYRYGMMTDFYSTDTNPAVALDYLIAGEVSGRMVVKDGCFMDILNGHHQRKAVCELKVEDDYAWTEKNLRMQQCMPRDG